MTNSNEHFLCVAYCAVFFSLLKIEQFFTITYISSWIFQCLNSTFPALEQQLLGYWFSKPTYMFLFRQDCTWKDVTYFIFFSRSLSLFLLLCFKMFDRTHAEQQQHHHQMRNSIHKIKGNGTQYCRWYFWMLNRQNAIEIWMIVNYGNICIHAHVLFQLQWMLKQAPERECEPQKKETKQNANIFRACSLTVGLFASKTPRCVFWMAKSFIPKKRFALFFSHTFHCVWLMLCALLHTDAPAQQTTTTTTKHISSARERASSEGTSIWSERSYFKLSFCYQKPKYI